MSLNRFVFFLMFSLSLSAESFAQKLIEAKPIESSPREQLRLSIFGSQKDERKCKKLEMTYSGDFSTDASLAEFVKKILTGLNDRKFDDLSKLFHERLKIRPSTVEKNFAEMDNALTKPQFTVLEIFALNSPNGETAEIQCGKDKDQDLFIHPQFGYPLQFSLWLQASGEKELGRLHIGIVPDRSGAWKIGLWQHFQWTHDQKDFLEFAKMAEVFQKNGRTELAYLNYDASEKFLRDLGFVRFGAHAEVKALKDKIMSEQKFSELVKSILKDEKIKAVVTNYIDKGMAIVVRTETTVEVSLKQAKDYCTEKAALLGASKEFKGGVTALRCGFVFPKENPSKDGVLGSYLSPVR